MSGQAHVVAARLGPTITPTQPEPPSITRHLAERFAAAASIGGFERLLDDNVVYLVPGRSKVAGLHRGRQAVVRALTAPPSGETSIVVDRCETTEVLASGDRAVVIIRMDGSTGNGDDAEPFSFEVAFHLQMGDERIIAITEYSGDQYATDMIIGR